MIPTYGRLDRLSGVVANAAATPDSQVYLVMEPDEATDFDGAITLTREEGFDNYAVAVNFAYRATDEPLLFAGADDLDFKPGWFEVARAELMYPFVGVVGTNDLGNPEVLAGEHATHYLVARWYLDEIGGVYDQGPGSFLPECYDHNWTDREFIFTAQTRGLFAPCLEAVVEHRHPAWGTGDMDETYQRSFRNEPADADMARERRQEFLRLNDAAPE